MRVNQLIFETDDDTSLQVNVSLQLLEEKKSAYHPSSFSKQKRIHVE